MIIRNKLECFSRNSKGFWLDGALFQSETEHFLSFYKNYIESLPLTDEPEIFGMHENANLAFSRNETATVVGTILDLQPLASGGSGGQSTDDVVKDMAEAILAKIDILLDIEEGKQSLFDLDRKGNNYFSQVLSVKRFQVGNIQ